MLSIGGFAQIGQVTHRMLRHWDRTGLLVPAHTDPFNGYRSYDPEQLQRLHRIVALRQLGFSIEETSSLLRDGIDAEQLTIMLQRRRAEVEKERRTAAARLADVERRLQLIEGKTTVSTIEIVQKPLPAVQLAAITVRVNEQPELAGVVGPSFDAVAEIIGGVRGALDTPIAAYTAHQEGIEASIGYAYDGAEQAGFELVKLPAAEDAFAAVHLGEINGIRTSWQALHQEIIARGFEPAGPCRELYLRADESGRTDEFVVELQQPVRETTASPGPSQ
ncbi:MerR family transcriptional regulator [Nesterenkonia jeotgali]|uniref:DNA-binding transcriptional MerR regulator/effector-binding domain-containing protein n=1 Tax=Nesterenkonia jeotgali TaxID=317018 RepID=A0A839FF56_9MICC|nr:MerR family transcriptional regulator [Nesterenkonia jeotgali]MBA8920298.1 DNA-binding transcriptional MerR regulator/effector-binding domain-containing protein [Nesterenkonia jeotgali]